MSKHEITMRLLSAEAKVPLHHMRAGTLSDEDWSKLARRMGEIADAPLYIDDSPNMTMMEIRARRVGSSSATTSSSWSSTTCSS